MLQTMRHLAQSWVFKGLMLILIISFGIWGIGDIFRGNPLRQTVAKAGDDHITVQQLNSEFEQAVIRARQMLGQEITPAKAKQMGVLDQSLDAMIERSIIDQETHRLGLEANAKSILQRLAAQPQFRDKDGHFNATLFRQLLAQQHLTEDDFIEQGRQDLARRQLIDVFQEVNKPSSLMSNTLLNALTQRRIFDVLEIPNTQKTSLAEPKAQELHDFYQKNQDLFTAPEYRSITIGLLTVDAVAQDIVVHEDEIKKAYEDKKEQMFKPERRDLVQVLLHDEALAKKIAHEAQEKGSLESVSLESHNALIHLDQTQKTALLPELADPVFALHLGQISDPIKSSLGWHVIEVKKISPSEKISYHDAKDEISSRIQHEQAIDTIARLVNQLDDDLAAGRPLEEIADALKLKLIKIPLVDRHGKNIEGQDVAQFQYKDDALKTAFEQNSGDVSPVMEDHKDNYYVVRTDDIVPSSLKPYEKVKEQVHIAWQKETRTKQAAEKANKIAQALRDGRSPSSFVGEGIEFLPSKAITLLGDKDAMLPANVLPQLVKLKIGEVITTGGDDKQYVIRLSKILSPDSKDKQANESKVSSQLTKQLPEEFIEQYIQYLQSVYAIHINQNVLESMRQQGS